MMMGLSARQLTSYEGGGFLVIEDFTSREECERLKRRAEDLVRIGHALHDLDPVFDAFRVGPNWLRRAPDMPLRGF